MPGLQRAEEIVELGLMLLAEREGAAAGEVVVLKADGGVEFAAGGGASFPAGWTVGDDGSFNITPTAGAVTGLTINEGEESLQVIFAVTDFDNGDGITVTGAGGFNAAYGGVDAISCEASGGGAPEVGFFGAAPVTQRTGVAVTAAGIHAALVSLGLITA